MSEQTGIEWCDHTFNPWWGCTKVSPACTNCYAETFSRRVGQKVWGADAGRRFFGDAHWAEPLKWNRQAHEAGVRRRVFCASMADVFEDREDLSEPRRRLFDLIEKTPALDWLLLTKRPDVMLDFFEGVSGAGCEAPILPNIWVGTTVENQEYAALRLPVLVQVRATVHFVSYEPALGPVDFTNIDAMQHSFDALRGEWCANRSGCLVDDKGDGAIEWIIIGGESGPRARPFDLEWARSTVAQCKAAGVQVFLKQLGARPYASVSPDWSWNPNGVRDKKGGDISEFPSDLQIREFP